MAFAASAPCAGAGGGGGGGSGGSGGGATTPETPSAGGGGGGGAATSGSGSGSPRAAFVAGLSDSASQSERCALGSTLRLECEEGGTADGLTNADDEEDERRGERSLTSYDSGSTSCTSWANLTLFLGLAFCGTFPGMGLETTKLGAWPGAPPLQLVQVFFPQRL